MTSGKLKWETLVRHIAIDTDNLFFTKHVWQRMQQRQISRQFVYEVLRKGVIRREPEPDLKTGHTQCRMERVVAGQKLGIVIAIENPSATTGIVITAMDL